jgi:hypothetical protein
VKSRSSRANILRNPQKRQVKEIERVILISLFCTICAWLGICMGRTRTLHDNTACELLLFLAILLLVEVRHSLDTSVCGTGRLVLICLWLWRFRRCDRRRNLWSDCVPTSCTLSTSGLASGIALDACKWPRGRQATSTLLRRGHRACLFG